MKASGNRRRALTAIMASSARTLRTIVFSDQPDPGWPRTSWGQAERPSLPGHVRRSGGSQRRAHATRPADIAYGP